MVDDNKDNHENIENQNEGADDTDSSQGSTGSSGDRNKNQTIYEVLQDLVDKSEYGSGPLVNQIVELHKRVGIVKKVLERILLEKLGKWKKSKKQDSKDKRHEKEISKDIKNKLKK